MSLVEVATVITALGGFVAAIVAALTSARRTQVDEMQTMLDELQEENGRLRGELTAEMARNLDLRRRVQEVEDRLQASRRKMSGMEDDLKQARAQIEGLTRENAELRDLLAQYRGEKDCEAPVG